ncbi:Rnh202p NDAI_0C04110 [Naumovozyma dairenensis CBS 421]|uniref:Ribonuclease H2 subunit B n=1 Tax=Naumovozyma dairenensis (strain ATCC 10597 / BCRC 20456 / CBS 421 / NBRC 0211 / NRRL Y-12639) TaxID=1071378 RepID=G0W8G0_NAUDC|nr:hypothetical protein NDAI_0C04110 [Naumovozyma dairenensis CBS 421]CCD24071.1 hypothetical protein NDAI_0C04110 [Naumovozyma dairenensis CBS 421]
MTVEKLEPKHIVILPKSITQLNDAETEKDIEIFTLPHPTNNPTKSRIPIIQNITTNETFQLISHSFSKGSKYTHQFDLANGKYHYTNDDSPIKSTFLIDENDRSQGYIMESSYFQFSTKYDITYNLIGFLYRKTEVVENENDYVKALPSNDNENNMESITSDRFLTLRDFHDTLVDSHDKNWSKISLNVLENALNKICDCIQEAGDTYYKINPVKITEFLVRKVEKINDNFPKSIPIPYDYREDIKESMKTVLSCNLLISLIPKRVYDDLIQFHPDENSTVQLSIKDAHASYIKYKEERRVTSREKEILLKSVTTVGLNNGTTTKGKIVKKKTTIVKKKVAKGKGAIDGFFKAKKK